MTYNGYQITCGCHCARCGSPVMLEGLEDADGMHYCHKCDNHVQVFTTCDYKTPEKVAQRQMRIDKARNRGEL